MESVIRDGLLRLQTAETSCDVILSCQGHRLMAHKVILSIASPILRELLLQDNMEPSVIIFPDINANIMSLILDYIYTGNVRIYTNTINEFINTAKLLKLHLDLQVLEKFRDDTIMTKTKQENCRKNQRKLPNLIPLNQLPITHSTKKINKQNRRLRNYIIPPNPWCPRIVPVLADPRIDFGPITENLNFRKKLEGGNDSNNNINLLLPTSEFVVSNKISEFYSIGTDLTTTSLKKNNLLQQQQQQQKHLPQALSPSSIATAVVGTTTTTTNNSSNNKLLLIEKTKPKVVIENKEVKKEIINDSKDKGFNNNNNNNQTTLDETTDIIKSNKEKPFKCNDCGKCFSQLRNFKYHRSVHEGTKEFAAKCPECGKIFNDRGYLSSHMKIHRDRKEYACPHCPKRFNQRVAYNMHLRIHTGIKPHECSVCGKSFSRKMLLKQHQRVHTGERPYSCPECGKTFADRSNMSLHARLHTGVKPYACNLCPKSFTKKHHLKTHMNFHTGLKPYTCQKCGLAFSQSSNMRTHYKKCILKSEETNQT